MLYVFHSVRYILNKNEWAVLACVFPQGAETPRSSLRLNNVVTWCESRDDRAEVSRQQRGAARTGWFLSYKHSTTVKTGGYFQF